MFYLPSEYNSYKYACDYGDNYIALTKSHHIYGSSGDLATIPCIYQYFTPSIYTIEGSYSSYDYETFTDVSSQFSDSVFARSDFPILFVCEFFIVLVVLFVINNLSKLFYKGGLFGPN